MKIQKIPFATAALLAAMAACTPDASNLQPATGAAPFASASSNEVKLVSNSFIMVSRGNQFSDSFRERVQRSGGKLTALYEQAGIAMATSDNPNFLKEMEKNQEVQVVMNDFEANWIQEPVVAEEITEEAFGNPPTSNDNDRFYNLQWGHDAVDAPEAWNAGYRGEGAVVAVLDGGFDLDHGDLDNNIISSVSFVPGEGAGYALPSVGSHGSHTAGIIGAEDNGVGTIGVAPKAKLMLVKVLRDTGRGNFSWIVEGILHAANNGADVINMSLGAMLSPNGNYVDENGNVIHSRANYIQKLRILQQRAMREAEKNNVTVIASLGNDAYNFNDPGGFYHVPSNLPGAIAISATTPVAWATNFSTSLDILASYSNHGVSATDLAAPGGSTDGLGILGNTRMCNVAGIVNRCFVFDMVMSTGSNLDRNRLSYYWSAGTSMAAPYAAGVAAILIGKNGGTMNPVEVKRILQASADDLGKPGKDEAYGHGRVNAFRAVSM